MTKIPTVLLVLGSTNAEIMRIHSRYPILAFFLSIANINKRPDTSQPLPTITSPSAVLLGPYGSVKRRDQTSKPNPIAIWILHILAAGGVGIIVWQTVEIGRRGVLSWACWTDFYPLIWVAMAVVHHVLSVSLMRTSLRVTVVPPLSPPLKRKPSSTGLQQVKEKSPFACWDLTQGNLRVEVKRRKFAKWSKAIADLVNNVNYLCGTAVFASITLVSGRVAIQKLSAFGIITVAVRIAAVYVLEDIEGED